MGGFGRARKSLGEFVLQKEGLGVDDGRGAIASLRLGLITINRLKPIKDT